MVIPVPEIEERREVFPCPRVCTDTERLLFGGDTPCQQCVNFIPSKTCGIDSVMSGKCAKSKGSKGHLYYATTEREGKAVGSSVYKCGKEGLLFTPLPRVPRNGNYDFINDPPEIHSWSLW